MPIQKPNSIEELYPLLKPFGEEYQPKKGKSFDWVKAYGPKMAMLALTPNLAAELHSPEYATVSAIRDCRKGVALIFRALDVLPEGYMGFYCQDDHGGPIEIWYGPVLQPENKPYVDAAEELFDIGKTIPAESELANAFLETLHKNSQP